MAEREPTGRHRLADLARDFEDSPEPAPLPKRPASEVTISLPAKAIAAAVIAVLGGGGIYGGHLLGSQRSDAAVAELHAMDSRVRKIEDARLEDAGERKRRDQELNDKLDAMGKALADGLKTINDRLDRRGR